MNTKLLLFGATTALFWAIAYQILLRDVMFITFGLGRKHDRIGTFPYKCRRVYHPLLESCEDKVLDGKGRRLYAACFTVGSRKAWSPSGDSFDASGRGGTDHVSVIHIDEPGPDGLYGVQKLEIVGDYVSALGRDKVIDVHGMDIEVLSDSRVRVWVINHRPPIDEADASKIGANSTIEVFEHERGSGEKEWVRTIVSEAVYTPNGLVAGGEGGVYVTNDHKSARPGIFRFLEMLSGGGNVAYCFLATGLCHIAAAKGFNFANGITGDPATGNIYVANSGKGTISVLSPDSNHNLLLVETIELGMPIDNLSIDKEGSIFAAGFPDVLALVKSLDDLKAPVPSTVFKVSKKEGRGKFEVSKVLEDIEGKVLRGNTVAVYDVEKDAFWMGGMSSDFVVVCKGKA